MLNLALVKSKRDYIVEDFKKKVGKGVEFRYSNKCVESVDRSLAGDTTAIERG
jgi:hypothetical protein